MTAALCMVCSFQAGAQDAASIDTLQAVSIALNKLHQRLPLEKAYVQFDKPYYAAGDTAWFKAYLLNADSLNRSHRSGVLYTEWVNDHNEVVKRVALPLAAGLSWGDCSLDTTLFHPGSYTFRAYTSWMLNFGQAGIYQKHFHIIANRADEWMATLWLQQSRSGSQASASAHLQLQNTLQQPLAGQQVKLHLLNGTKVLHSNTFTTDTNGGLDVDFAMPAGSVKLSLLLQDSLHSLRIPLLFHRSSDIDLQFMPEGGDLLAGQRQRLGFKAIGEDGKGVGVAGKVLDSRGKEVAAFHSLHLGMGDLSFTPLAGEHYVARLSLPDSVDKDYPLPAVQTSGTLLQVRPLTDSLLVKVLASADLAQSSFLLLAQAAGGQLLYSAVLQPGDSVRVSTRDFPSGILRFTLMDLKKHPLNERLVFVDHHDRLRITVHTDSAAYMPHGNIALHISVKDSHGLPVSGSFSLAVTDDSLVKIPAYDENILSYFDLSSCLNGFIEEPGWYFSNEQDTVRAQALDDLLLTQGWVGYDWKTVFNPPERPAYQPEPFFAVKGQVRSAFNKPVHDAQVTLMSWKPALTKQTVTDKQGRFSFIGFPPMDTAQFLLQARNKRGKSFNVGIVMDELKPPVMKPLEIPAALPWNVNMDTSALQYMTGSIERQQEIAKANMAGHVLKEIVVKANKIVHGSHNLNGPGEADIVLDEEDMKKAGKMTLLDLLKQKVKGFRLEYLYSSFMIPPVPVCFFIDGLFLNSYYPSFDSQVDKLNTINAEDVRGIEVMTTIQHAHIYNVYLFADPAAPLNYIEVTTRSGKSIWEQKTPGTYIYKPIPFSWPHKFYHPRYNSVNDSTANIYSTIHWEPVVETDTDGTATVSFYAAGHSGTYTIITEGSDMNGHLGYCKQKIVVKPRE